jgi:hypothetical protein
MLCLLHTLFGIHTQQMTNIGPAAYQGSSNCLTCQERQELCYVLTGVVVLE